MLAIFPLLSLIILSIIFTNIWKSWRRGFISAIVAWGVFLTVVTEILSWLNLLNFSLLLLSWLSFSLFLGSVYFKQQQASKQKLLSLPKLRSITNVFSVFSIGLIISIFIITLIVGLIAIVAPPNTWDSMTYHMSRVVHWIQNGNVAHYPTYNLPQLFHPPFAEFAIMHLQILSGSDRFANLVQWFSSIGSIIGVSLIAKELNTDVRGQVFAAVFCATIPMGILQASSTQNDYAVGFWLVCLAYFVLLSVKYENQPSLYFLIGASLGLAILTKSSGYLYAFPFMVWFSLISYCLLRKKLRERKFLLIYLLSIISGFLLLCLLLKIQIYQPRHHLLAFLLFSAFVGVVLAEIPLKNLANGVAVLLIVTSLPWVFQNKFRPIAAEANIFNMSRIEQYFINRPQLQQPYTKAVERILSSQCTDVGLSLGTGESVGNEYWEYPLWVLFQQSKKPIRIENIPPKNVSAVKVEKPPYSNFIPCTILAVRNREDKPIEQLIVNNNIYVKTWSESPVILLTPEENK